MSAISARIRLTCQQVAHVQAQEFGPRPCAVRSQRSASGVSSPKFVGSTLLRSLSMCCSMTQLSVKLHQDLCQCNRAELAWAWLRYCCPSSGFFGPQSRGELWLPSRVSLSGTVPQPASTCPFIHATQLVPPPCVQWPRCLRFANCWGPAPLPAQHPWPRISPASPVEARFSQQPA